MEKRYKLAGLHCANCGEKIRSAAENMDGVDRAALNVATSVLTLTVEKDAPDMTDRLQRLCDGIESGITVFGGKTAEEHSHARPAQIKDKVLISVSAVLTVTAFVLDIVGLSLPAGIIFCVAAAIAVARPALTGIKGLVHFDIDENVLLFIAVVAAVCIGQFAEAAMVSVLFAVGQYIESLVSDRSRGELEKISSIRPDIAHTAEGDLPADSLSVGDIMTVRPFERIPLDGTVISGSGTVDASAITGESIPVTVEYGTPVLGGMLNGSGVLQVKVTGDFHDSAASRIIRLVEESVENKGSSERFITRFARIYTPCVVVAAVLVTLIPSVILGYFSVEWLKKSLVFLVASCPCALVISVPLAFYAGVGLASRKGVLIKGGAYIEALASADSAAFDKTGTLTSGKLTVTEVTGTDDVLSIAAAVERHSDHPVAHAVCAACKSPAHLDGEVTERAGFGVEMNGQQRVLVGAARLMEAEKVDISDLPDASVYVAVDGRAIGCIKVSDTVRPTSKQLADELKKRGFKRVAMLTGDTYATANDIALQCGITDVRASLLPQDKVGAVDRMRSESHGTLFLGDGINDAPVIAAADVGVAMGLGTDAAVETADAVLMSGDPASLLTAIDVSRRTMGIVRFNIALSIAVKLLVICSAFFYPMMWAAVVADVVLSVVCSLNSARLMVSKAAE